MSMKDSTFIRKYAEKNKEPDQKYCPNLWIYWHGKKDGNYYTKVYDPKMGTVEVKNYNDIWDRSGTYYSNSARSYRALGIYAKQIRDGKILEIGFVKLDNMKRGKDGEIRKWEFAYSYYGSRAFLTKSGMVYNADGTEYCPEENGRYYNKRFIRMLMEMYHQGYIRTNNTYDELSKFAGVKEQLYIWKFIRWYKNMKPRNKTTNPLLSIEFNKIENCAVPVVFQAVNENLVVFRMFNKRRNYTLQFDETVEEWRIFVDNKGKVTVLENSYNSGWRIASIPCVHMYGCYQDHRNTRILHVDTLAEFPALEYIATLVVGNDDVETVNNIITMLRHPIVEMFAKAGYDKLSRFVRKNKMVKAKVKEVFGADLKKEKGSLTKMLGVNKYMLQKVESEIKEHYYNTLYLDHCPIKLMREYFGNKLQSLTESDINMYYDVFCEFESKYGNASYYLDPNAERQYWYHRNTDTRFITEDNAAYMNKLIPKLAKLGRQATSIFMDAMNTYKQLMNKPEIDWLDFRKEEDIERLHNNLVVLLNTERKMTREQKNAQLQEVFEKKQKKRIEKFEDTTSDDVFEIVVPKNLTEITTEGQSLSHCVGGYLERHANGNTNILFLRRKAFPLIPFYTIEVDNNDYVVQIHGRYNRWLGNDPDAIAFVYKWLKERELRCEEYKLLDTSSGYGKSGKEVSRDYLVA